MSQGGWKGKRAGEDRVLDRINHPERYPRLDTTKWSLELVPTWLLVACALVLAWTCGFLVGSTI